MPIVKSHSRSVEFGPGLPVARVGERINPTGKTGMQENIKNGDLSWIADLAREQERGGANVLGVNVGMPGIDEPAVLTDAIAFASDASQLPLYIDSSVPKALMSALESYPHVPLVGSATGEESSYKEFLDFIKGRDAVPVIMLSDEKGVPKTAGERIRIADKVLDYCASIGYNVKTPVFDCMAMSVGVDPAAGRETLECIRVLSAERNASTIIGLSNVSFGMPDRVIFNRAYAAMAVASGLSAAILNPNAPDAIETVMAADVLVERDEFAIQYLEWYRSKPKDDNDG